MASRATSTSGPAPWERENWIDDGPLRSAARKATLAPNVRSRRRSMQGHRATQVAERLHPRSPRISSAVRTGSTCCQVSGAAGDGRRCARSRPFRRRPANGPARLRDLPAMAFGHEIAGLALYRTGQWRKAAAELESPGTRPHVEPSPVLADCYRALKRYDLVDQLWLELREGSPSRR